MSSTLGSTIWAMTSLPCQSAACAGLKHNKSVWHCYRCNKYADLTNPAQTSQLNNYSHSVCISHVQTTPSVVHDRVFLSHPIGTSFSSLSFFWSGNTAVSIWNRSFMFCSFNLCFESSKYCKTWGLRFYPWLGRKDHGDSLSGQLGNDWENYKWTYHITRNKWCIHVYSGNISWDRHIQGLTVYPYLESSNSYIYILYIYIIYIYYIYIL